MRLFTKMRITRRLVGRFVLLLCVCSIAPLAAAQSTDITAPSAIRTNEISGEIVARDIGDARLTDHYYAFTGTPGDVVITVQSQNLDGDVDIFTASGLRPLLKFSLYSGIASPVTKSVYLRTTEQLILRIEARTPNDDRGVYRFRFGGSFEPITTGPLVAEAESTPVDPFAVPAPAAKKGRRVSSVGARIDEPAEPEVATATPEPTPEALETKTVDPNVAESRPTTRTPARSNRGRRPSGRRTRTPPATPEETATTPSTAPETPEEKPAEVATPAPRGRRGSRRGGAAASTPAQPAAEQEVESGPRLIIETNDGTLINRYMSSVRRVTVENGRVVVIGKDGKIERFALETVVRMSIAP